jgi:hypothetical protein
LRHLHTDKSLLNSYLDAVSSKAGLSYKLSLDQQCHESKPTVKSFLHAIFPDHDKGKEVFYQGSRQMTSTSRRYYEKELGAGIGPGPGMDEMFGYTEPLRRFVQREDFTPQTNEIANTMPSWMPGDDYYTNFRVGDPYVKVDQGFARLPGEGYAALHPELDGVNPEDLVSPSCRTKILSRGRGMALAHFRGSRSILCGVVRALMLSSSAGLLG